MKKNNMQWKQPIPTNLDHIFGDDHFSNLLYRELIYRSANKDGHNTYKGKTTEIKRGQVFFGRNAYAKYLCADDMRCERALRKLEKIYKKVSIHVSKGNFTIVQIEDYENVVRFEQSNEQLLSNQRATDEQPVSTSKSDKNEKNADITYNKTCVELLDKKHSKLDDITQEDLQIIAAEYKVSVGLVNLQLEALKNYCSSNGKKYKNYYSALKNFVLKEMKNQTERRQNGQQTQHGVAVLPGAS